MTGEIQSLWKLHELDDKVVTLTESLARYPAERTEAEARLESEKKRLEGHKERVAALQRERRALEQQTESLDAEERKFKNQLPQVKKNEEYQALLHEISGTQAKRSNLETAILEKFEEEEQLGEEAKSLAATLQSVQKEVDERIARIQSEEKAARASLEGLESERQAALEGVPPATRSRYERIRASRQGRAVVPILKNACGGCFRNQPPQALQEARRGDRLISCDGCGRLLIWPPDGS